MEVKVVEQLFDSGAVQASDYPFIYSLDTYVLFYYLSVHQVFHLSTTGYEPRAMNIIGGFHMTSSET